MTIGAFKWWWTQFAKTFSPRVLLMLVLNVSFFYGNIVADNHQHAKGLDYPFTIGVFVWLGIMALEILIITGIVTYDQILETKHDYNSDGKTPKKPVKKPSGKPKGRTTGTSTQDKPVNAKTQ